MSKIIMIALVLLLSSIIYYFLGDPWGILAENAAQTDPAAFITRLEKHMHHKPQDLHGARILARTYMQRNQFEQAQPYYQMLYVANPADELLWLEYASTFILLGQKTAVLDELIEKIQRKSTHSPAEQVLLERYAE